MRTVLRDYSEEDRGRGSQTVKESIRFLHISDTHFGVHYATKAKNLYRRAYGELFFKKIEDVINEVLSSRKIDFIIHSGDFFNRSNPPASVVDRAVKPFVLATKKEIPIYVLPGNHERGKLPLGLLPFSKNINLFRKPCSFIFEKDGINIKLTGFPYIRYNAKAIFNKAVQKAWNNTIENSPHKPDYSILVVHQLIEGSCIEGYTFRKGDNVIPIQQIPKKFHYVACGHVHRFQFLNTYSCQSTNSSYQIRQDYQNRKWKFHDNSQKSFDNPVIAYAGSLERVSMTERNVPKGFIIGKLNSSGGKIQAVSYQFQEVSAIKMIFCIWDLSKNPINDCINQTLEVLSSLPLTKTILPKKRKKKLTAICSIKIKGSWPPTSSYLDFLKQEAKKHSVYLTFSRSSSTSEGLRKNFNILKS